MEHKSVGIYVPARLKSERLPNKQILPIGDTCMFDIACRKLKTIKDNYKYSINTYAMVYDKQLVDIAEEHGVAILRRNKKSTECDGPLLKTMGAVKYMTESHCMFLNPCLIFLSIDTIISSIITFLENGSDYATSVKPFKNWLFNHNAAPVTPIDYDQLNTKTISGYWQAAHAFHIFNRKSFLENGKMLDSNMSIMPILNQEELVDIDTMEDYLYAKWKWEASNMC